MGFFHYKRLIALCMSFYLLIVFSLIAQSSNQKQMNAKTLFGYQLSRKHLHRRMLFGLYTLEF